MQKELRDLRQEIGIAESQLRLNQNQARSSSSALPMLKNPSSSSLNSSGSKHAVLLNELPGNISNLPRCPLVILLCRGRGGGLVVSMFGS